MSWDSTRFKFKTRRGLPVFRTKKNRWTMVARGSLFFNKSRVPEKSMKGRLKGFVFRDISLVLGISPKMLPRAAVAQPFFFVPQIGNPCRAASSRSRKRGRLDGGDGPSAFGAYSRPRDNHASSSESRLTESFTADHSSRRQRTPVLFSLS